MAEQTVEPHAVKSRRQHVEQKAPQEFRRVERHRLGPVLRTIVGVAEAHVPVVEVEQALVGDRHPVRVAADVVEQLRGTRERAFRVDDPLGLPRGPQ